MLRRSYGFKTAEIVPNTAAAASALALILLPTCGWAADPDAQIGIDEIVVSAARTPTLIRDEPLRIEAVPADEIEENLTIAPGNLSSLLRELPGVMVKPAGPALGGVGLQLRGMPARHTLMLTDGLPLAGAEADGFGLLQMPPLDLARVEVIKGAVSALYGQSGPGGVLNLVSRMPDSEPQVLMNATSRGGRDLVGFFTGKGTSPWSATLTAGAHYQSREDVDGDGWADLAGYRRFTLRPRLWWHGGGDRSLLLTAGIVDEIRTGGTLPGRALADGSAFIEALRTRRLDAGAVSHWAFDSGTTFGGRLSLSSVRLDRAFGVERIPSTQTALFGEGAWSGTSRGHRWVFGVAFERDRLAVPAVPGVSYTYTVPGVFLQDEYAPSPWMTLAGSLRVDAHDIYGTFVSPRVSALLRRPGSDWSLRASVGSGFAAPTPFIEEIAAVGLGALLPLQGLHAESAISASLDAKWSDGEWDVNVSVFASEIRDPLEVQTTSGRPLQIVNARGPRRAPGAEVLVGFVAGSLHAIASWSYLDVTEVAASGVRTAAPLVPRHSVSLDGILESEQRGRVGLELGYIGRQVLADNPYRRSGRGYFEVNALAERRFGRITVFLNALNLADVRQTQFDPLLRPGPGPGGDPIVDAWAPLDGRTFNLGIRAEL
ncbi:MAG: TonB-dependent receptor [Steroidobacteraceae bacterium]